MTTDCSIAELPDEPKKVPLVMYFGRDRIVLGEATLNPDGTFSAKVDAPADSRAAKVLEAVPGEFRFSLPKKTIEEIYEQPEDPQVVFAGGDFPSEKKNIPEIMNYNPLPPLVSDPFPKERYFEHDVPVIPRVIKNVKFDHISVNTEPSIFEKATPPEVLPD